MRGRGLTAGGRRRWLSLRFRPFLGLTIVLLVVAALQPPSTVGAVTKAGSGAIWKPASLPAIQRPATATLDQVACNSASSCFGVGVLRGRTGLIMHWNGSSWSQAAAPVPTGVSSELLSVACPATKLCFASGETFSGATTGSLIMSWNGAGWAMTSFPSSGSSNSQLRTVACISLTDCWALGSVTPPGGQATPLALQWNGSAWKLVHLPSPPSGFRMLISRMTCVVGGSCFALSELLNTSTYTSRIQILKLTGSSWTSQTIPNSSGLYLEDIACASTHLCFAGGSRYATSGAGSNVLLRWSGSTWAQIPAPEPGSSGATDTIDSLACSSPGSCVGLGQSATTSGPVSLFGLALSGGVWKAVAVSTPGVPSLGYPDATAIACPTSSHCLAVGLGAGISPSGAPISGTFTISSNGSSWSAPKLLEIQISTPSRLTGMACPAVSTCFAVGYYRDPIRNIREPLALRLSNGKWSIAATPYLIAFDKFDEPTGGGSLNAITCTAVNACWAVGYRFDTDGYSQTLALRWTGTSWREQPTVNPGYPSAPGATLNHNLAGIACASASNCWATGAFASAQPLAIRWNGSTWSNVAVPPPGTAGQNGAGYELLNGVSCAPVGECVLVGTAQVSSGFDVPVALQSSGASLRDESPLPAPSLDEGLNGISCATSATCLAVGVQTDESGSGTPIALQLKGSTWKQIPVPASMEGGGYGELTAVFCIGAGACEVAGYDDSSGRPQGLAGSWNGSTWAVQVPAASNLPSPSVLDTIACAPSPDGCWAAGYSTSGGIDQALVLEHGA